MKPAIVVIILIFASMPLAAPSHALLLCAKIDKKTGEIRDGSPLVLRSACKTTKKGSPIEVSIGSTEQLAALQDLQQFVETDTTNKVVRVTGANLQIRSGDGASWGTGDAGSPEVNGLGNLIIGYDEDDGNDKTGSHNLVVGPHHTYSQAGGVVAGFNNAVSGSYASVVGGRSNTASGVDSVVSGGNDNTASGIASVVSGGFQNTAQELASSVSGGRDNIAAGIAAVVSGGSENYASGVNSVVSAGDSNTAGGQASAVSGGNGNTAQGAGSSVSGGTENAASGILAAVSGGTENSATGSYSVVSGGQQITASGTAEHAP
jgi:hypothetical protein